MRRHPVCQYYAKALIQTARDVEEAKRFRTQLVSFGSLLQDNQNLYSALLSTWVRFKDKEKILGDLAGRIDLEEKIIRFLRIIVKNKRMELFSAILDVYTELLDQTLNIKKVMLISPLNVTDNDIAFVKSRLTELSGMDIKIENTVDPTILGGVKLILDGKVYDNSISSKLNSIRKSFLEA